MADISTESLTRRTEGAKRVYNVNVNFTRISLTGDGEDGFESSLLGNQFVQLLYLFMVTIKYLQKGGLCPRRAFGASKAKVIPRSFQIPKVQEQILDPQAGSLSHRRRLGGLSMSVSQARQTFVILGESRKPSYQPRQRRK